MGRGASRRQNEEAHNCALIGRLLEKAGVPYSHATGEFYDKAVAIKGPRARIEFLIRGLKWAVKRFEQAFPTPSTPPPSPSSPRCAIRTFAASRLAKAF